MKEGESGQKKILQLSSERTGMIACGMYDEEMERSEVKAGAEYWKMLQCHYLEKSLLNSVTEPDIVMDFI